MATAHTPDELQRLCRHNASRRQGGLNVEDIRSELQRLGLSTAGSRDTVKDRLCAYLIQHNIIDPTPPGTPVAAAAVEAHTPHAPQEPAAQRIRRTGSPPALRLDLQAAQPAQQPAQVNQQPQQADQSQQEPDNSQLLTPQDNLDLGPAISILDDTDRELDRLRWIMRKKSKIAGLYEEITYAQYNTNTIFVCYFPGLTRQQQTEYARLLYVVYTMTYIHLIQNPNFVVMLTQLSGSPLYNVYNALVDNNAITLDPLNPLNPGELADDMQRSYQLYTHLALTPLIFSCSEIHSMIVTRANPVTPLTQEIILSKLKLKYRLFKALVREKRAAYNTATSIQTPLYVNTITATIVNGDIAINPTNPDARPEYVSWIRTRTLDHLLAFLTLLRYILPELQYAKSMLIINPDQTWPRILTSAEQQILVDSLLPIQAKARFFYLGIMIFQNARNRLQSNPPLPIRLIMNQINSSTINRYNGTMANIVGMHDALVFELTGQEQAQDQEGDQYQEGQEDDQDPQTVDYQPLQPPQQGQEPQVSQGRQLTQTQEAFNIRATRSRSLLACPISPVCIVREPAFEPLTLLLDHADRHCQQLTRMNQQLMQYYENKPARPVQMININWGEPDIYYFNLVSTLANNDTSNIDYRFHIRQRLNIGYDAGGVARAVYSKAGAYIRSIMAKDGTRYYFANRMPRGAPAKIIRCILASIEQGMSLGVTFSNGIYYLLTLNELRDEDEFERHLQEMDTALLLSLYYLDNPEEAQIVLRAATEHFQYKQYYQAHERFVPQGMQIGEEHRVEWLKRALIFKLFDNKPIAEDTSASALASAPRGIRTGNTLRFLAEYLNLQAQGIWSPVLTGLMRASNPVMALNRILGLTINKETVTQFTRLNYNSDIEPDTVIPVISAHFTKFLNEASDDKLTMFLHFITASNDPVTSITVNIQRQKVNLPTAHTCFKSIDVKPYGPDQYADFLRELTISLDSYGDTFGLA